MNNILEHPQVTQALKTGYPSNIKPWKPKKLYSNVCRACDEYEAEVNFRGMTLCSGCSQEEGITIL